MTAPPKKRPRAARSLAELAPECLGGALKSQGFANAEIVTRWPEIVGPELAECSEPVRLAWPRRGPAADPAAPAPQATLVVRVEGAFALELQHMAAIVVERVNRYFGWACVGGLRFQQGPVRRPAKGASARPPLDPAIRQQVAGLVQGVEEPRLADALRRLGEAVAANKARKLTGT